MKPEPSALHAAVKEPFPEALRQAEALLRAGADATFRGPSGATFIHEVFFGRGLEGFSATDRAAADGLLLLLVEHGADPWAEGPSGADGAMIAAMFGFPVLEEKIDGPPLIGEAEFLAALADGRWTRRVDAFLDARKEKKQEPSPAELGIALRAACAKLDDPSANEMPYLRLVRALVEHGARPSDEDLHFVVVRRDEALLRALCSWKASAGAVATKALWFAVRDSLPLVPLCLELGADAGTHEGGRTPLMSMWHGARVHQEGTGKAPTAVLLATARALLAAGADPRATDDEGRTAEWHARAHKLAPLARLFAEASGQRQTTRAR